MSSSYHVTIYKGTCSGTSPSHVPVQIIKSLYSSVEIVNISHKGSYPLKNSPIRYLINIYIYIYLYILVYIYIYID
jgi:hypothetical protein